LRPNDVGTKIALVEERSGSIELGAMRPALFLGPVLALLLLACGSTPSSEPPAAGGSSSSGGGPDPSGDPTTTDGTTGVGSPPRAPSLHGVSLAGIAGSSGGSSDPGPKPTATCTFSKDSSGFFTRTSGGVTYVGYIPASYTGKTPMRLVVGLHGCGDTAYNFATWAVAPYDTLATQDWIAVSVDGATGGGACWNLGPDDAKVAAAAADISSCVWVHQKKIVIAGYSSGGELAYRVGMMNADKYAGILIEDSGPDNESTLIAGAARKLPIAHLHHSGDTVFPLATIQSDWTKLTAAGFPLQTDVTPGTHDGTSTDWSGWIHPKAETWVSP
jgi:predicted esterase